ncbi:MAG: hypothetical protein M1825_004335 [Sarcosagium campestre]|nr:MAG: hypothetical protein M1825_004335 [Sarcosagium campestre]
MAVVDDAHTGSPLATSRRASMTPMARFTTNIHPQAQLNNNNDSTCSIDADQQTNQKSNVDLEPTHRLPESSTSHPSNPVPEEPESIIEHDIQPVRRDQSPHSATSFAFSESLSDYESPATPQEDSQPEGTTKNVNRSSISGIDFNRQRKRRASTKLISGNADDVRRLIGDKGVGTQKVETVCCGGGCCFLDKLEADPSSEGKTPVAIPDNDAFRSLHLKLGPLSLDTPLTNIMDLPASMMSFTPVLMGVETSSSTVDHHPPQFVSPHPPYSVYPARVHHARELTKVGAEKRTYHFDLDVTDYPEESGTVDFMVGGAIGLCAPNERSMVDELFNLLGVPRPVRDRKITLKTQGGRWPTIWGDETARELTTSRRELVTWCSDLQSYPPTKQLLRILAEYATAENEKKILTYLTSIQGQAAFCELRTASHLTIVQLLSAFPSSKPPLPLLLSHLPQLMPRFYSLSNDPHISTSCIGDGESRRRLIEIAVSVHETSDWHTGGVRTGVGSGYLERIAKRVIAASKTGGTDFGDSNITVPIFRGLMSNPLAREFVTDGPMLLIGAGVGIAPFRGFVQRRLKSANCANKVWVLQGVRDSLLDELYSGEWGVHEDEVKKVVQSRRGEGRYVQEEVRHQADLVWFIINALDGRVFVCGSSAGMGEGVESALVDVAMEKGKLNREEAEAFWQQKKEGGQYIAETW